MSAGSLPPTEWNEVLILIHGISPEPEPESPDKGYDTLVRQINNTLPENKKFKDESVIKTYWGTGKNSVAETLFDETCADEYLGEIERRMARKIMAVVREP